MQSDIPTPAYSQIYRQADERCVETDIMFTHVQIDRQAGTLHRGRQAGRQAVRQTDCVCFGHNKAL